MLASAAERPQTICEPAPSGRAACATATQAGSLVAGHVEDPPRYRRTRLSVQVVPVTDAEREEFAEELAWLDAHRPRTRADCKDGPRPCPFVGCRWHLGLDVARSGRALVLPRDREPWELPETCALDVADRVAAEEADEPHTMAALGASLGLRKQRIDQILDDLEERLQVRLRASGITLR